MNRRYTARPTNIREQHDVVWVPQFRVLVHPVSYHGVRARWFARRGSDRPWSFIGELIMATAEWQAYRAHLPMGTEAIDAPPIIGGYWRKAA